jgi:predicted PhzF superfamily epimerase YddE/YHI9
VSATTLHTLRVFLGPGGGGGNPLGVILDGAAVPPDARQEVAAELGFSETVFVDDAATGALRIFTPAVELPLAGHPLVGTAWLLAHTGAPVDVLRPPAGDVPTWSEYGLTWIRARREWAQLYGVEQLATPAAVDAFAVPGGDAMLAIWAWEDEAAGRVRARVFPNGIGIEEDEATGAAALQLGGLIGRDIVIRQGEGSELHARPGDDGTVAVGGRVELSDVTSTGGPSLRGPKGETPDLGPSLRGPKGETPDLGPSLRGPKGETPDLRA